MSLTKLSVSELKTGYAAHKFSVTEVVQSYLARIHTEEPKLNAFITVSAESALAQAKELDKAITNQSEVGELFGVPVAVKDVIVTKHIRSTGGSKILENYIPPYNATIVDRAVSAGAVVLGKTNCDEFAMGSSGENSGYGPTVNPHDASRVPGGSSSGSAAAVAAGEALVTLGTDTGGSIRQPASFCGVVGVKPTYGRVSRYGLMAMASSFDQAGVFARTVTEAAQTLQNMAGYDPHDATSSRHDVPRYAAHLNESRKFRLGVPQEFFGEGVNTEVKEQVENAIAKLAEAGHEVQSVSVPSVPYALACYYVITPAEVSANLARYDGLRFGKQLAGDNLSQVYAATRGQNLGAEVKRRIMLGTYVLSAGYYDAYYKKAQAVRASISQDFARTFEHLDALITPTTPTTAFKFNEHAHDPLAMYAADINTVPVNIAGLPAISVPWGKAQGMPVGVQVIARAFDEITMFQVAHALENLR